MNGRIEYHPENGRAPYVLRMLFDNGADIWFGYPNRERAERKLIINTNNYLAGPVSSRLFRSAPAEPAPGNGHHMETLR